MQAGPYRAAAGPPGASWAGALPDRAAALLIAGLSALLWATLVRVVVWTVAAGHL